MVRYRIFVRTDGGVTTPPSGSEAGAAELQRRRDLLTAATPSDPQVADVGLYDLAAPRRVVTSDVTYVTQPNTVHENIDFLGRVVVQAPGYRNRNCRHMPVNNPTNETCMLSFENSAVRDAEVEGSYFEPQTASYVWTAIKGHHFTARSNHIRRTATDGFGTFNTFDKGSSLQVLMEGNRVEDLRYFENDNGIHVDGTHNDCWQHHGGRDVTARRNHFSATLSSDSPNRTGFTHTPGQRQGTACIMIGAQQGTVSGLTIVENFLYGGELSVNAGSNGLQGMTVGSVLRNKVDDQQRFPNTPFLRDALVTWEVGQGTPDANTRLDGSAVGIYEKG